MNDDPRFTLESEREVFSGTQLLVKGALEASGGVGLLTGCGNGPVSGYFHCCESIGPLLRDRGVLVRRAASGAEAVAIAHGSQIAGCRVLAVLDVPELHGCAHELSTAAACGVHASGGAVIAVIDPTWSETATSSDSRRLFEHLRIPLLEPAEPQEAKDWIDLGLRLSAGSGGYAGLRLTGELATGGGSVELRANQLPAVNLHQLSTVADRDFAQSLPHFTAPPASAAEQEGLWRRRVAHACAEAQRLGVNRVEHRPHKGEVAPLAFIAAGAAYAALADALEEMGLTGKIPVLKLGLVWPVDDRLVRELAAQASDIVVIEAGPAFVESQVQGLLAPLRQAGQSVARVWGKVFPEPLKGLGSAAVLSASELLDRLVPLVTERSTAQLELSHGRLSDLSLRMHQARAVSLDLPPRAATFCSGCPQRDVAGVLRELRRDLLEPAYMHRVHRIGPVELAVHSDGGCTSLLALPPHSELSVIRGSSGFSAVAAGAAEQFLANRQIVFIGEHGFWRSGRSAVANALEAGQDVTFLLVADHHLDDVGGRNTNGPAAEAASIERLRRKRQENWGDRAERRVRSIEGPRGERVRVARIDPEDRQGFRDALERAVLVPGVKLVIADKPCALSPARGPVPHASGDRQTARQRRTVMRVVEDVCEHCLECTRGTGCPGLDIVPTDYGPKIQTSDSACVNDGACARIQVCPAFERVTVVRTGRWPDEEPLGIDEPPPPPRPRHADQDTWRCAVAGVGGMGVQKAVQVLAFAGREMGYHVRFTHRKGAAVRTGPAFGQAAFSRQPRRANSAHVPYGRADLLLALEPLEGARAIDGAGPYCVASPANTAVVVNTHPTATGASLHAGRRIDPDPLRRALRRRGRRDQFFAADITEFSRRSLGSARYANIVSLGVAFQLGQVPVTVEAMERSIRRVLRRDAEINVRAFRLGRHLAADPRRLGSQRDRRDEPLAKTVRRMRQRLSDHFGARRAHALSARYLRLVREARGAFRASRADSRLVRDFVIRLADCAIWSGGIDYPRRYARRVLEVLCRDSTSRGHAATRAVIWNLAKVMLIKDEVYVASLLSSAEKQRNDRARFDADPSRGDRIIYHRYHRPQFSFLGRRHTFEWHSSDRQLRLLARCRWLRALPGWSRRDRRFREWYEKLVDRAVWTTEPQYRKWVAALSVPEQVTGFREIRWPKLDAARIAAEAALTAPDDPTPTAEPRIRVSLSDQILTGSSV